MTDEPAPQRLVTPATELAEAVDAQIEEAREVLQADAVAAGVDPQLVDAAVDAAADGYRGARVHAFIGILIERQVRAALRLGHAADGGPAGTTGSR